MTAPRLGAGDMVAGKYSIRSHVREDGTISTHFAADANGREVAIKLYTPDLGARQDVLNALQTVHAKVASLPPDLVVPVLDAGVDGQLANALYTVTERVALLPLPRLGSTAIGTVLRSLARTLEAAHAQGLFHHALSPGNVLVDGESPRVVRVLDFGMNLARAAVPTQAGFAHAAPWMAPEQIDGANAGASADVFAVGLLTFHMLTGGSFWRALGPQGLDVARYQQELRAQRGAATQRANELKMNMPSSLDAFFARALALQPQQRFGTVTELAGAFEKAMQNPSIAPGPMKLAAPAGAAKFKQTQYAAEADPTPAPPKNRFKSTQYAADPQAEMAKAVSGSQRPPPGGGTLLDHAPVPPLPQHLAGPPVAAAPIPSPQRSWPPPGDVVVPTAAPVESMPPPAPPKSSKAPLIIVILLLLIGGGAAGAYYVFGRGEPPTTAKKDEPKKDDDEDKTASTEDKTKGGDDDEKGTSDDEPKKKKKGDDDEKPAAGTSASAAATDKPAASAEPPPKDAAEVTIQCNPACDAVSIDGKALADPAAPAALAAGSHTVVASKAGYKSTTDTFTVKAKTPTTRVYTLVLAPVVAPKASAKPPCGKFLKKCD
jgi:serine/threonine protein kinase